MNARKKPLKPKWICFLCGSPRDTAAQHITLHKFPTCPETRKSWLVKCNLEESDNVSNIRICSKHFVEQDYRNRQAHAYGGVLKLKAGVIPSMLLPSQNVAQDDVAVIQRTPQFELEKNRLESVVSQIPENENTPDEIAHDPKRRRLSEPPRYVLLSDVLTPRTASTNTDSGVSQIVENASDDVTTIPKRKILSEPRYIGDILPTEEVTPGTARRILNLVDNKMKIQKRNIHALREKNRRFLRKIRNFKQALTHLRENNLVSPEAENALMGLCS